uniref:Transmembrane protein n=1 Tax=Steinernema glaseri TaxID=37863 RepID=A0A1I7ZL99_9BILA
MLRYRNPGGDHPIHLEMTIPWPFCPLDDVYEFLWGVYWPVDLVIVAGAKVSRVTGNPKDQIIVMVVSTTVFHR